MIVIRTLDASIPITIGNHPQLIKETMEDDAPVIMDADVINKIFLAVYDENEVIGMARLCPDTRNSYEAHIKILPQHRGGKAIMAGEHLWRWIQENLPDCVIYSKVPRCCKNVTAFLEKFDFAMTGIIPNAWLKNGSLHDVLIYTREVK